MKKPIYNRGDIVYLKSSSLIGRLDSFRIDNIYQKNKDQWLYEISIGKKPPERSVIGDSYDKRTKEPKLVYFEEELVSFQEALTSAIDTLTRQIEAVEKHYSNECSNTGIDEPIENMPKFEIEDIVYLDASARNGFFQSARVLEIYEVPIQPGTQRKKFSYRLDLKSNIGKFIYFREDEIITKCEAYPKVLSSMNYQLQVLNVKL